ncbi:MAG TPA: hypothetical protein VMF06_04175 [Candidatus Limnocylindria bacterium]|nr:hypothetical protein [Candidatus Limnocylindria bacterium]
MKHGTLKIGLVVVAMAGFYGLRTVTGAPSTTGETVSEVPAVIRNGLTVWTKKGATYAFDVWQKGGLLEDDRKPQVLFNYFHRLDRALGNYRSCELIDIKAISPSSEIVYLSMNFDRAAVYSRFLLYRTDKAWVIQNMDFSPKPEAIMPWLAFSEGNYSE